MSSQQLTLLHREEGPCCPQGQGQGEGRCIGSSGVRQAWCTFWMAPCGWGSQARWARIGALVAQDLLTLPPLAQGSLGLPSSLGMRDMCPSEMSFLIHGAWGLHLESLPLTSGWCLTPLAPAQAESGAWWLY